MKIVETNGAPRVRTWATVDEVCPHLDEREASVLLRTLQNEREFRRKFIYDCLLAKCRELEHGVRSYATEFANWGTGFVPVAHRTLTESKVKDVIKNGMDMLMDYVLEEVTSKAVYCVKEAREILRGSVGEKELTKERANELYEKVKPLIYGGNTPLIQSLLEAVRLFTENRHQQHKLLFILSDGQPTDGHHPPLRELSDLGVTVVCCYITRRHIAEPRRLYSTEREDWEEPAKFMFSMSSSITTQKIPRTLFVKKEWTIDIDNNKTRLFFQVNHPDIINEVCDLAKDCVCSQDSLSDVLSSVSLDIYINKAYEGLAPHHQVGKTCYAVASATVMHLAMKRIVGREGGWPDFYEIRNKLISKYGKQGAKVGEVLHEVCPQYRLQKHKTDDVRGALKAIVENRPVVAIFQLSDAEWKTFNNFYHSNPRGILTKSHLNISTREQGTILRGHAVVLTSFNSECLRLMNSKGSGWADGGFFRVQNAAVLGLEFYDIFWSEDDLLLSEKEAYRRDGADISAKLMKSLTSLKEATCKCPSCEMESNVSEFRGHLLEVQCPICRGTFNAEVDGSDLALNIYLTSLTSSDTA